MKKIFLFLVAATLLASCNSETEVKPDISGKPTSLTFSIGLPAGDPVTYAIQTNEELKVNTLDIYQFNKATGALEATYRSGTDFTFTQSGAQLNVTITANSNGEKTFLFVANNDGKANLSGLYNGFKSIQVKPLASASGVASEALISPLMMTAEAAVTLTGTPVSGQAVELKRIMSRIDIKNMEPALYLTKVTLKNAPDRSYVFPQTGANGDEMPAGVQRVSLPTVDIPDTETPRVGIEKGVDFVLYKHLFYPYINNAGETAAQAPALHIQGVLKTTKGDVQVAYDVPLKLDNEQGYIRFARNTRYTLVIANAYSTTLNATIKVELWNTDLLNAQVEPRIPVLIPPILGWTNNISAIYDKTTGVVSQNAAASNLYFYINRNTEWTAASAATWLTVSAPLLSFNAKNYYFLAIPDQLTVTVTKNDTGAEREALITLTSKVDTKLSSTFKIKQAAN